MVADVINEVRTAFPAPSLIRDRYEVRSLLIAAASRGHLSRQTAVPSDFLATASYVTGAVTTACSRRRAPASVRGSKELVAKANGVFVFPSVLKVGFIAGGEYSEGVLQVGGKTTVNTDLVARTGRYQ